MLRPDPIDPVPVETARIAHAAFPKGNLYLRLREEVGTLYSDQQFASLFSATGQPALPPWRLALVTIVQFLEGLTDRQAADAVRARIDLKHLLGLALDDPGFHFSALSEFRHRLIEGRSEAVLLDTLLDHFRTRGLLRLRGRQRTDSTHVLGAIRVLNRLELVAETFRAALNELATVDPFWLTPHLQAHWVEWYAHRVEEHRLPKGEAAREAFAAQIGQDGQAIIHALDAEDAGHLQTLSKVRTLRLVWSQQFDVDADDVVHWKPLSSVPPASERPASPYDPEAHFASKRSLTWQGYKVHLTETCDDDRPELIVGVLVTPAPQRDLLATSTVHQQLANHHLLPEQHLVDAGYVSAHLLTESRDQFGIDLIGPAQHKTSWQERTPGAFTLKDFRIDWDNKDVYCPQNFLNSQWVETFDQWGTPIVHVEFRRRTCERCPVRALCTRTDPRKQGRALVFRRQAQHTALQAARAREAAADWKNIYSLRDGIEATMSQAVRRCDLRHARYRGQAKTRLQMLGTAAALDLIRMDAWLMGTPRGATRTARFARLPLTA